MGNAVTVYKILILPFGRNILSYRIFRQVLFLKMGGEMSGSVNLLPLKNICVLGCPDFLFNIEGEMKVG